jgi:putative transposase
MARPLRIEYEYAIYHVYARGHRREHIFQDAVDKKKFLEKLSEVIEKFQLLVHCYVLMDNHYHLLITTPNANLSRAMHHLNAGYSNWYKAKHKIKGILSQVDFVSTPNEVRET